MLVKSYAAAVQGISATVVTVEVNCSKGIQFFLVGLPDVAVRESHERIISALQVCGYKAKKFLKDSLYKYDVIDYGTDTENSVDFPIYAKKLGTAIQNGEVDLGIAICGTGIGMSITLNKMKGVYCAKVSNESEAILCKAHNDANCIAMSEELDEDLMLDIVDKFINTPFTNVSKYIRRNDMIKELEK